LFLPRQFEPARIDAGFYDLSVWSFDRRSNPCIDRDPVRAPDSLMSAADYWGGSDLSGSIGGDPG
jgi:hypothetical protein